MPSIVDEHGQLYSVGTALLESEKLSGAYEWILTQMVEIAPEWKDVNSVILTDKGMLLMICSYTLW